MPGWQELIVVVIVVGAACYVARAFWRSLGGRSSCGCGSNGCARDANPATEGQRLVQLNVHKKKD
ncbi:MAG: hypothetical protein IID37_02280 [Planctomycetes bacterium]|nr:hypothetical protein [Planctomycetota bacterium]